MDTDDSDNEGDFHCRRFRILVMGKAGVGKSTLLSKVFGVSEDIAGVVNPGEGNGQHSVWTGIVSRNNPLLVIHDSRGFEAAETSNLEEVKRFIEHCAGMSNLEKQLHCIWYCIDCSDSRFWSEAEKKFLAFFQNRAVPIVFVLTKFDLVIAQCLSSRLINSGSALVDWVPMRTLAIGDASERVKKDIHRPLEKILGGGVKTEMVSKENPELVEQLVIETTKVVKPNLKQLWIGAQQVIADNKRQGMSDVPSINHSPAHANCQAGAIACSIKAISSTYIRAGILIPVPLVKPVFHQDIFHRIYTMIRLQWNICDHGYLERDAVVAQFQDLCQGSLFSFGRAVDPTGPLTGPHYMREYLRWAADLNIAFEILFWKLKERGNGRLMSPTVNQSNQRVLKKAEVEEVLALFQNSRLRTLAHTQINGSVNNFDLSLPFKRKDLRAILESAVDTATAEGEKEGFWSHRPSRSVSSDHVAELE